MSDKETEIPGLTEFKGYIPPENIRLIGSIGPVDPHADLGVSLHQDLESSLTEIMPEYKWIKDSSTTGKAPGLNGVTKPDRFMVDIDVEINPAQSVKQIVKIWKVVATSFIMAPSKAIEVFGLDEPDEPIDPKDDISRDYKILSIHIWPPASRTEVNVRVNEEEAATRFVSEKATADTDGRFVYRLIRPSEDICGNREKLIEVVNMIKAAADEANASLQIC